MIVTPKDAKMVCAAEIPRMRAGPGRESLRGSSPPREKQSEVLLSKKQGWEGR
jgi:hypothetical protein